MKRSNVALTPTLCQRTKPGTSKLTLWDATELGLALVITPAGNRCWWFVARRAKKQIWVRIGEYHQAVDGGEKGEVWTVDAARKKAAKLRKIHDEGRDIRAVAMAKKNPRIISDLAKEYRESVAWAKHSKKTKQTYGGYLDNHILPSVGNRLVTDLTYADVLAMQKEIAAKRNPPIDVTAGECVVLLGTLMDFAADLEWRKRNDNPCRGIPTMASEARTRIASAAELGRINEAIGEGDKATVIRLICVSGMRIEECLALESRNVDLDAKTLTIVKHKRMRQEKKPKVIPINAEMEAIFRQQAENHLGPWVFKGFKGGHRKPDSVQSWWREEIRVAAGVEGLDIHDLRRTFETTGVELGFPPGDMDVLVGHKLPGMQATYIHLRPGGILSVASAATSEWIMAALNGKRPQLGVRIGAEGAKQA